VLGGEAKPMEWDRGNMHAGKHTHANQRNATQRNIPKQTKQIQDKFKTNNPCPVFGWMIHSRHGTRAKTLFKTDTLSGRMSVLLSTSTFCLLGKKFKTSTSFFF